MMLRKKGVGGKHTYTHAPETNGTRLHAHTHTYSTFVSSLKHPHRHIHIHRPTHTHTRPPHPHPPPPTLRPPPTHPHTHERAHTHKHTHTRARARAHIHARTGNQWHTTACTHAHRPGITSPEQKRWADLNDATEEGCRRQANTEDSWCIIIIRIKVT